MSSAEVSLWWDKNIDSTGRPIRPDVRESAHRVWASASKQAQSVIFDSSQAAELMETTVAQISRYLDRSGVTTFSREIDGLIMYAFQKSLRRQAAQFRRLETMGGTSELSNQVVDREWAQRLESRLEFEQVVCFLSERSRNVLTLRYAGFTWKESARILGTSVSALRSAFWRDVNRVKHGMRREGICFCKGSRSSVPEATLNRR